MSNDTTCLGSLSWEKPLLFACQSPAHCSRQVRLHKQSRQNKQDRSSAHLLKLRLPIFLAPPLLTVTSLSLISPATKGLSNEKGERKKKKKKKKKKEKLNGSTMGQDKGFLIWNCQHLFLILSTSVMARFTAPKPLQAIISDFLLSSRSSDNVLGCVDTYCRWNPPTLGALLLS